MTNYTITAKVFLVKSVFSRLIMLENKHNTELQRTDPGTKDEG